MNQIADPTLFGVQMATDGIDGNQAVKTNCIRLAEKLGYRSASQTKVAMMIVEAKDGTLSDFVIRDGKFASAIFVEFYATHKVPGSTLSKVDIDADFLAAIALYMGARICAEARDQAFVGHKFLKAVLEAGEGAVLRIFRKD